MMNRFFLIALINRLDSHSRLYLSLALSATAFFLIPDNTADPVRVIEIWLVYALSNLVFYWVTILTKHPIEVRKIARIQDSSRTVLFIFVVLAAVVSLFAVVLLLRSSQPLSADGLTDQIFLSIGAVFSSWLLVHTIFTFRYAHLYYSHSHEESQKGKYLRGLEFPKETEPDYLDFTYFAFVIGMTFQVSDIEISSARIRRLALLHGFLSFIFNTVIVALSINVISGMIQK